MLPSPWPISQVNLLCLWAQGRPTMTCAASMPVLWSAPWWRLKWLHVLLFIHLCKQSQQYFAMLPWDVPALLACVSHPPVLPFPVYFMSNEELYSCTGLYFHSKGHVQFERQNIVQQSQRSLPFISTATFGPNWKVPHFSLSFETMKSHQKTF